jgi:hypothetical protein
MVDIASEEVSLIQIKKGYIIIERACSVSTLYFHKLSACCSRALLEGKQASEGKFSRKRLRGVGAFLAFSNFFVDLWGYTLKVKFDGALLKGTLIFL